jgi:stearoyl-CoA desaturase (delta-9 desaturase)
MIKERKAINWGTAIFLISYQLILLMTLPFYFYFCDLQVGTVISSIILLWLTGLSITAGYHRYYAHRSYKTNRFVEFFLLYFGTMAVQASALRWSFEHRLHHAFVDTDKDPYSIQKGFWYAHFLWMLEKLQPIDPKVVPDLFKNQMVLFQHRHYRILMVLTNVVAFFVVGALFNDYWGAFFLAVWLRIFCLQHFTWFINSLAHTWGSRHFSLEQSAVDNYIIALLTFGEGYHNFHHTFANDYRNGIRWYHFDPTKWLIWSLSKLGLAHNLKRTDALTIKKRLITEHTDFLIETLANCWHDTKQELEKQVDELSERILKSISEFSQLRDLHQKLKNATAELATELPSLEQIQKQINDLQATLSDDWRRWKSLSQEIQNPDKG